MNGHGAMSSDEEMARVTVPMQQFRDKAFAPSPLHDVRKAGATDKKAAVKMKVDLLPRALGAWMSCKFWIEGAKMTVERTADESALPQNERARDAEAVRESRRRRIRRKRRRLRTTTRTTRTTISRTLACASSCPVRGAEAGGERGAGRGRGRKPRQREPRPRGFGPAAGPRGRRSRRAGGDHGRADRPSGARGGRRGSCGPILNAREARHALSRLCRPPGRPVLAAGR